MDIVSTRIFGMKGNHTDDYGKWHKPDDWPDIESVPIEEDESVIYFLTDKELNSDSFFRVRVYGSGLSWSRGTVVEGDFIPDYTTTISSGGYITVRLDTLASRYTVFKVSGTSITSCTFQSNTYSSYYNAVL